MKTFFEPKINGLDDTFSNLTGSLSMATKIDAPVAVVPSLPRPPKGLLAYASQNTTTSSLPSIPQSPTSLPLSNISYGGLNVPSMPSNVVKTNVSVPSTTSNIPTSIPDGSYSGGGGVMQSGTGEESVAPNDAKSTQKTNSSKSDMLFGIKKSYVFGGAFLVLAGFVYFKYIKK